MAKCEANQIINKCGLYVDGIDKVAWVSQGSNFVHKKEEIIGARSKHGKEVYRFWWSNLKERATWKI